MIDQVMAQNSTVPQNTTGNYQTGPAGNLQDLAKTTASTPKTGVTGGPVTPFSGGITPLSQTPNNGRYPFFSPYVQSNEDLYALAQPWYNQAFNATTKGLGLAATTFLQGTVGLVNGVFQAVNDGRFASFYDNDFNRSMDEWNKNNENILPNYYSLAETNAEWYSPRNLLTANFLFDKVIKNLGFAAGAYASGAAYTKALQAIGLFSKIASAGGLARTASMSEDALVALPRTQQLEGIAGGMRAISNEFLSGYNTLNTAQRAVVAGLATTGEAGIESLQGLNDFRRKMIEKYIQDNGTRPDGDAMSEINRLSDNLGNTVFGLNVGLLTVTNYIQLPKVLGSSYRAERGIFNEAVQDIEQIGFDRATGRFIAEAPKTLFGKALKRAENVSRMFFSPSEAFEEVSQSAFQYGTDNYYRKGYANKETDILRDIFGEGYRQAFTTKEGIESLLIGGLSGGIMETVGRFRRGEGITGDKIKHANTQAAVAEFNNKLFGGYLQDVTQAVNRGANLQSERAEAIRRGDFQEAKDLDEDYIHNYLYPRVKYGRMDMVEDDLQEYRQLASTNEGFQQLRDNGMIDEKTTREQFLSRLNNIQEYAENLNSFYQTLNTRYSGLVDEDGKRVYPPSVIDKMTYAASKISVYDKRIPGIAENLIAHSINIQPIIDSLEGKDRPGTQEVQDALNQINNLNTISETKADLKNDLRDLLEISLRRREYMKEYDRMRNRPQEYMEEKYPEVPSTEPETSIQLPQEDEEGTTINPVEVPFGVPQPLGNNVLREGNRLSVFPELTIHERSLLGDYRVTLPTGEEVFATEDELRKYRISEGLGNTGRIDVERNINKAIDDVFNRDTFQDLEKPEGTLQEKIAAINELDNRALTDAIEEVINQELEKYNKIQDQLNKFLNDPQLLSGVEQQFKDNEITAGITFTGDPEEDSKILQEYFIESRKKSITELFSTSTSENTSVKGTGENNDFHRRANKFLNNFDNFSDKTGLNVIVVTRANQDSLGLTDLIPEFVPNMPSQVSSMDINEGIIRLAFVRNTPNGTFYVDVNGNQLTKVGEKPDFDKLVYTTMNNTSLNWRSSGETKYVSKGRKGVDEKTAKRYQEAWRKKRQEILESDPTKIQSFGFNISNGLLNITPDAKNAVTDVLVNVSNFNEAEIIIPTVSTETTSSGKKLGTLTNPDGSTINVPLGRPMLRIGNTTVPLDNRKFTEQEKQNIIEAISILARVGTESGTISKPILNYLQSILYWRKTASPSSNQIWFDTGYLYLGSNDNRIPFLYETVQDSAELREFLDKAFMNVNNRNLTTNLNTPYDEIIGFDGLTPKFSQWKSYKHFLLSDRYEMTQDDESGRNGMRDIGEIPLTTAVSILDANDEYSSPTEQKYIKLLNFDLPLEQVEEQKPAISEPAQQEQQQEKIGNESKEEQGDEVAPSSPELEATRAEIANYTKAGDFILDGKTPNKIVFNGIHMANMAISIDSEGNIIINSHEHLGKKELTPEKRDAIQAIAKSQVAQAILEKEGNVQQQKQTLDSVTPVTEAVQQEVTPPAVKSVSDLTINEMLALPNIANVFDIDSAISIADTLTPENQDDVVSKILEIVNNKFIPKDKFEQVLKTKEKLIGNKDYFTKDYLKKYILYTGKDFSSFEQQQTEQQVAEKTQAQPVQETPQSAQEKANEIFKNLKPRKNKPNEGDRYRIFNSLNNYIPENIASFKDYMSKVLPQVPFHTVENLIKTTSGGKAWGVFKDNAIYLYKNAEIGTGYHEVFEAVYAMYLTPKERIQLLNETRARGNQGLSESDLIDTMAEEFREYVLTGKLPVEERKKGFFTKLLDFIKRLIFGDKKNINDLFKRINKGDFAGLPVPYANRGERYRELLPGLNTKFIQDVMEGMTVFSFRKLFADNRNIVAFDEQTLTLKDLYDDVFNQMEEHFNQTLPEDLLAIIEEQNVPEEVANQLKISYSNFLETTWNPIRDNWIKLREIHSDFLRPFSIIFENDHNQDDIEANINENENKNQVEYERDILKIDARKNASTSVKLLFATLTDTELLQDAERADGTLNLPEDKYSDIKLPRLVKYAPTFNKFLHSVVNTNGLDNILNKIKELAKIDSKYIRLYNRLKVDKGYDQLSVDDWKLLMKLYTVASKQKPDYFVQMTDETGRTYVINSNDNLQTKQLADAWLNNLKATAGAGKLINVVNNKYQVDPTILNKYNVSTVDGKIDFIAGVGFPFSREMYDTLDSKNKRKFNESSTRLYNFLKKTQDVATISARALGISGPLSQLTEAIVVAQGDTSQAQHFNIEGEPVQNFILNNYLSFILNDINSFKTKDELLQALPHLQDRFSEDSLLLEKGGLLFDEQGNRRDLNLNVAVVEGSKNIDAQKGTATADLALSARRLQEFNQNLNGIFYVLLPADSKTEWSLNLDQYHYINFSEFNNKGALSNKQARIFRNYLQTEIEIAQRNSERSYVANLKKQGGQLRFFKDILHRDSVEMVNKVINDKTDAKNFITENEGFRTEIDEWIDSLTSAQWNDFVENEVILEDAKNEYTFQGLDADFLDRNNLTNGSLSRDQVYDILKFRTLNYVIHNIELHKVFFGDPALFTDATKRIKSYLSGRETTYHTDPYFNQNANKQLNTVEGLSLKEGDPGYWIFKDYMQTVTLSDVEVVGSIALDQSIPENVREVYENANEADAQSWISLPAYRELLFKTGGRWTDAQEQQFQYEMAYERQKKEEKGTYTYTNDKLKTHDKALVEKGNPEVAQFYVIKPIGSGVKHGATFNDLFLDKTSAMPMFYRLAEGKQMEAVYNKMQAQGISYAIMKSGRKVGIESLNSVYNADGTISTPPFKDVINVPFKYYGIQVETGSHKDGQTRGSQLTKLATVNLMSNGVPIDTKFKLEEWNSMNEEEKKKSSRIYREFFRNKSILEALADVGYQNILIDLSIEETADGYQVKDMSKVAEYIKREITRRELPDNIKDSVAIDPTTGDFTIPLEALSNYKILKNILYSIVDKNLLSPKMNGGPKVQISSTAFENTGREAVYKPKGSKTEPWTKVEDYDKLNEAEKATVRLTSNTLKFYTKEEPYIEVMLPHWFKSAMLEKAERKGITLKSDEEIIKYLNQNNSKLLFGVGFRIPTQDLNSVERFKVAGFLPQEMGDSIVVPTEIVVKAGSDFDIDKMNTYLKNFYIGNDGFPKYIEFKEFDTSSEEQLKDLYQFLRRDEVARSIQRKAEENKVTKLVNAIFGSDLELKEEIVETLEDFINKNKNRSIYEIYGEYNPEALENEYMESLESLLSLPENFNRLIQPNSAKELEDLRDEILEAKGEKKGEVKGNFSLLLDPNFMSKVRHNFISGKGGVGIAAVQQTNNALNQLTTIYIDTTGFQGKLSDLEKRVVKNLNINLPHNTVIVNGRSYPTLSSMLDAKGNYITDKVSAYINGFVDVAKDAFIIELGADLNVASTFMFLEKLGVPTRDVVFFMNQPIIRDYLKALQINRLKSPLGFKALKIADQIRNSYPASFRLEGKMETKAFKTIIEKKYKLKQKLTNEENALQHQVLDDFFKYYVMSSHLFKLTQGSNYDTANFNEPALIYRKQRMTEFARQTGILNSVDKLLNSSFIGNVADKLIRVKGALGAILKLDQPVIADMLEGILEDYLPVGKFVREDDYLAIANKLQMSFVDYVTQIYGKDKLNGKFEQLLLDKSTAVADQMNKLKNELPKDSEIYNNPVLQNMQTLLDSTNTNGVRNIKFVEKAYDSHTSNMYTNAFRELRDNALTSDFYNDLVRLAILQSGIKQSPISFTNLIPAEDYSKYLADVMQNLDKIVDINTFANIRAFHRANWNDDRVVPEFIIAKIPDRNDPREYYTPALEVGGILQRLGVKNGHAEYSMLKVNSRYNASEITYPVLKVRTIATDPETGQPYTISKQREMRKNKDYSFVTYKLYERVDYQGENGNTIPLAEDDGTGKGTYNVFYKQINAWGRGISAQEYYDYPRASVFPGNVKVSEYSTTEVINAIRGIDVVPSETRSKMTDDSKAGQEAISEILNIATTNPEFATENNITKESTEISPNVAPFEITGEDFKRIIDQMRNNGEIFDIC